jgi:hypothetical protein
MKGKLVKRSNGRFDLYKIEDVDQLNTIASSFDNPKGKLSLKNCQAIELGYDLNELVKEDFFRGKYQYHLANNHLEFFKAGFQKALEILGDKKFSEDDILKAIEMYYEKGKIFIEIIQSLQQTEWDVEVETHPREWIKKLDEDGCLILKRL